MKVTEITTTRNISGGTTTTSNSFVANRSFISTGFGVDDLRRSQIVNLPNHRKIGLGENLPMVVVFQAIEIERLSMEVESNRIKIKDFERQIFNSQNYEVQIRELTEKLFSYQREKDDYMTEIQKLNVICHQLYTELEDMKRKYAEVDLTLREKYQFERGKNVELTTQIERWKSRYMASERSKQKQLDDLRLMMESQRKSMVDREMRELTLRFQTQRGSLENQIRKLRESLQYKNRELQDSKKRLKEFEVTILELKRHESTIRQLQNKLGLVTQQMHRLNQLLKQKQDEVQGGRQREFKLQQQLKEQSQWEVENRQLKNTLENRLKEIQDWKIRANKLEAELDKGREVVRNNQELSIKISTASREVQRLNDVLRGKLDQIDQWKQKFARQESQTNRYKNLQGDIKNYETKIMGLTGEIERLNGVMKNRLLEAEEWKNKCSRLEVTINNYQVVEKTNKDLEARLKDNTRMIQDLKGKIGRYELQINNYKILERKMEESDRKNGVLNSQIDRLNIVIRSKIQENDDFRVRHSNLESRLVEYNSVEGKVKEYQIAINNLTRQLEEYNNQIRVKTDEAERYKGVIRRLEQEVAFLQAHEIKLKDNERNIQGLQTTITQIKRTVLTEQDRSRGLQNKIRDMEQMAFGLNQEKERVSNQFRQKSLEFEELRNKYSKLEQEVYVLRETEQGLRVVKNQLMMISNQKERLEKVLHDIEIELQKERSLADQLGLRVVVLCSEIERAQSGSGMKSKQFKELQERFYSLQTMSKTKDGEIEVMVQKIENFEKKIIFISGELQKFVQLVTQHEHKARVLEQEITQFQDYAKRIQILAAEIDRITGQNRGLEEDLQKLRLRYADNITFDLKMEQTCLSFVLLMAEVESLRGRLSEREVQFQEMRKSILNPVRNINQ